jgi:hypothetical protein
MVRSRGYVAGKCSIFTKYSSKTPVPCLRSQGSRSLISRSCRAPRTLGRQLYVHGPYTNVLQNGAQRTRTEPSPARRSRPDSPRRPQIRRERGEKTCSVVQDRRESAQSAGTSSSLVSQPAGLVPERTHASHVCSVANGRSPRGRTPCSVANGTAGKPPSVDRGSHGRYQGVHQ